MNFIDFIIAIASDKRGPEESSILGGEFFTELNKNNSQNLSQWFKERGYGISVEECQKLFDNQATLRTKMLDMY